MGIYFLQRHIQQVTKRIIVIGITKYKSNDFINWLDKEFRILEKESARLEKKPSSGISIILERCSKLNLICLNLRYDFRFKILNWSKNVFTSSQESFRYIENFGSIYIDSNLTVVEFNIK